MSGHAAPNWLVARPIAHRGLHDAERGLVENSLGAARAAMGHGFAIECDVQLSRDGDAVVFHDFTLDRLTDRTGPLDQQSAADLAGLAYRHSGDRLASLTALLDEIDGRVPLICEIKSRFDGDLRLSDRVRAIVERYAGPIAVKSFDPRVIAHLRRDAPCPLGLVAQADYEGADDEWSALAPALRRELAALTHLAATRPDFLSYRISDLPHAATVLGRALAMPVMTWTIRRPEQLAHARLWADQIVFEGFLPE